LMVFNATFNNISVISWRSVYRPEYPEKTTNLSQVTDKLNHIMFFNQAHLTGHMILSFNKSNIKSSFFDKIKKTLIFNKWWNVQVPH
jgi:hypothetical protein